MPLELIKKLEAQVNGLLGGVDIYSRPAAERKAVTALKHELVDARLDIRDYEFSDTRAEQLEHAKAAKRRLERIRKHIAGASSYNVFSSADVAHLGAQIERIIEQVT